MSQQLYYLNICKQRQLTLSDEDERHYYRLNKGAQGEALFLQLLEQHLPSHWRTLHNLWLTVNDSETQIDQLIITPVQLWLINVKNYSQPLFYEHNQWTGPNGQVYDQLFYQIERSQGLVQRLIQKLTIDLPLEPMLVFVEPQQIERLDQVPYAAWTANEFIAQIYWHLSQESERIATAQNTYQPDQVAHKIRHYDQGQSLKYHPKGLSSDLILTQARAGIACPRCHSFHLTRKFFFCCNDCGHREAICQGLLRTIHDYLCLRQTKTFTRKEIELFTQEPPHSATLTRVLHRYFDVIGRSSGRFFKLKE